MRTIKYIQPVSFFTNKWWSFVNLPFLLMFGLWVPQKSNAQQIPMTSHSFVNPIMYNPAEIGQFDYTNVYLHTRRQWVGMPGAPETYLLTVDGALENKKVGLGLVFSNDVTDIVSRISGSAGYRYSIKLPGEDHAIRLGLMGSVIQNRISFDKVRADNPVDQTLFANAESSTGFDANAGIQYRFKGLKVGFSAYQLLGNHLFYKNQVDDKSLSFRFIRHFYSTASYQYQVNDKFMVEPRMLLKSVQGMPLQADLGAYTVYDKKIWGGVTWQSHYGVSIALGGNFYNRFTLGYSYDLSVGAINKFTSGSHEVVLGIKLFKARAAASEAATTTNPIDDVERLKRISKEQDEAIEKLHADNKTMKQDLANTNQNVELQKEEMVNLQKIFVKDSASIKDVINKYSTALDQLGMDGFKRKYKKVGSAYIDTTVESTFKDVRYYVVMGTFLKFMDARLLQQVLARELNVKTLIIAPDNNVYFVYSSKFSDSFGVKAKIKAHIHGLEKKGVGKFIQGDIWIYKTRE